MTEAELGECILPVELQRLHKIEKNREQILARAKIAVAELAPLDGDEFITTMPKALMLLALLDHLHDRRTCGMIPDYLDF